MEEVKKALEEVQTFMELQTEFNDKAIDRIEEIVKTLQIITKKINE